LNHQNPLAQDESDFEREVHWDVIQATLYRESPVNPEDYPDDEELVGVIKRLKNSKSPGVDGIRNILLKKLPERGRMFLLFIICACMKLSYFPTRWKHAKVIAIPKPGKNLSLALSYRPISLLSSISKILERIVLTRINNFIDEHEIIPPEQHGFRAKFSTTRQLHNVISDARQALSEKDSMGFVMLDVEKAFDRVWHQGLLYKMDKLNFPTHLVKMVSSFLKNRSFHVELRGRKSTNYSIPFGVPQGAVLSPTLYNIYIHDVPKIDNTRIVLFADDTGFYSISQKASVIETSLKAHSQEIERYAKKWKITMNASKTQATFVTRRRKLELPGARINLMGSDVNWRSESKYLGVIIDKAITLKPHIDYVIERANIAIRVLYPLINRKSKLDLKNKLAIYKLAIRPILTYACPAMRGIAKTHIKKLQVLQNKTLKMILNVSRYERTALIHEWAEVPMIDEYINKLTDKFLQTLNN
jgi:Reverse transcriptase (RNA-dependent DNA polymerase)